MPVPDRGTATCLRATGAPGGLSLLGDWTRRDSATDLITAGASGLGPATSVRLGSLATCAETAGDLVAGPVRLSLGRFEMRAASPSSAPVALGDASFLPTAPAVAISSSGHAVVAWAQHRGSVVGADDVDVRVVAVRRAPGGGFGPVEALTRWRATDEALNTTVVAGIDDAGAATVAASQPLVERRNESEGIVAITAATAPPGRPFAVQRIGARAEEVSRPALAVAGDGGALLAYGDSVNGPVAFERAPGVAAFAPVEVDGDSGVDSPAVALGRGGGALIAWKNFGDSVLAVRRAARGPFGSAEEITRDDSSDGSLGEAVLVTLGFDGRPSDEDNARLRAVLAPDGRVLLTWAAGDPAAPRLASGTLAGGFGRPQRLGSPVRDANGVVPMFLADGRAAVAWTDNAGFSPFSDFPDGDGRLHLAVDRAPRIAEPPPPRLTVSGRRRQRLFASQPLRVTARCDRACDVRARATGRRLYGSAITASRATAGPVRMRLPAYWGRSEDRRRRDVRVVVRAASPAGHRVARATLRTRVFRRRSLPVPRLIGLRARRAGAAVVVTWRTRRPARRVSFAVDGRPTRRGQPVDEQAFAYVRGRGRTRFAVRLRPRRPDAVRWVLVQAFSYDGDAVRDAAVRVR